MPPDDSTVLWQAVGRLSLALGLGAAVGLEREWRRKPAGLRTMILISFGAALFTLLSDILSAGRGGQPFALAQHLIAGVGFLGAGAIIQSRGTVTGLTTAASIFALAAIGMACGGGLFLIAALATAMLLVILGVLGWAERRFEKKVHAVTFSVSALRPEDLIPRLTEMANRLRVPIRELHVRTNDDRSQVDFCLDAAEGEEGALIREVETIRRERS